MEERVSVHTYVLLLFSVGQEQVEWWIHCLCVSKKEKSEWGGLFLMRREFGADKEAKLLECQQEGSMYVCMCVHACVCASNYISFYSLKKKNPMEAMHRSSTTVSTVSKHALPFIYPQGHSDHCVYRKAYLNPTHTTTPLFLIPCFGAAMSRVKWRANIPGCHYSQTSDQLITKTWGL